MNSFLSVLLCIYSLAVLAQSPGSTCETAINAGEPGFVFPELPPGTKRWYYFNTASTKCKLNIPAGNSFVLYEYQGDDFCASFNNSPAKQKMLAKRNLSAAEAGFSLPAFSEEAINGKCDCNACTGGKFNEELNLKPGTVYYFLIIGQGKNVKIDFIPPVEKAGNKPGKTSASGNDTAIGSIDLVQRFLFQKPLDDLKPGESIMLKSVNFEHATTQLMKESYLDLERVYKYMKQNPKAKIEVQGHVDGSGTKTVNKKEEEFAMKLSEGRAKVIRDYLVKKGIEASRITYKGYGSSEMVYFGNIENYLKYNRRVVVKVLEK